MRSATTTSPAIPSPARKAGIQQVGDIISAHTKFVLTTHRDPDGDGLGAEAALVEALKQLGKEVRVVNNDPVPVHYRFLPESKSFETYRAGEHRRLIQTAEVVVLLDAARPDRTGRLMAALGSFRGTTLAIDHHPGGGWAQVEFLDPEACATAALVHDVVVRLTVAMTPTIAEALYTGIVADTQGFRTPNTTAEAHMLAARLLDAGASAERVQRALFAWPVDRLRFLGHFLAGLRTAMDGRLVWGVISQGDLRHSRQSAAGTEGFVEQALGIAGAELAILFLEETHAVRVSFRSRSPVRVDGLARELGGGGHAQASGTLLPCPLNAAVRRTLKRARQMLADEKASEFGKGGTR